MDNLPSEACSVIWNIIPEKIYDLQDMCPYEYNLLIMVESVIYILILYSIIYMYIRLVFLI